MGGVLRHRLQNTDFTLIANNCCGGIIYHTLHEKFLSPTINLYIPHEDFISFLNNLDEALSSDIRQIEVDHNGNTQKYPLGEINLLNGESIHIHFVHYVTFKDAVSKWKERCQRINRDKTFVLMEMGKGTNRALVERFDSLPFKNKVAITDSNFDEFKSTLCIDIYGADYIPGKSVKLIPYSYRRYIDLFDYTEWLNTGRIKRAKFYKRYIKTRNV